MNNVHCDVCSQEYDVARGFHTCDAEQLRIIFLKEVEQPERCGLNGDDLKKLKQAIEDNGSPEWLVSMWEDSARRKFVSGS